MSAATEGPWGGDAAVAEAFFRALAPLLGDWTRRQPDCPECGAPPRYLELIWRPTPPSGDGAVWVLHCSACGHKAPSRTIAAAGRRWRSGRRSGRRARA